MIVHATLSSAFHSGRSVESEIESLKRLREKPHVGLRAQLRLKDLELQLVSELDAYGCQRKVLKDTLRAIGKDHRYHGFLSRRTWADVAAGHSVHQALRKQRSRLRAARKRENDAPERFEEVVRNRNQWAEAHDNPDHDGTHAYEQSGGTYSHFEEHPENDTSITWNRKNLSWHERNDFRVEASGSSWENRSWYSSWGSSDWSSWNWRESPTPERTWEKKHKTPEAKKKSFEKLAAKKRKQG